VATIVAPGGGAVAPAGVVVLIALESLSLSLLSGLSEGSLDQSAMVCSEMSVKGDPNGDLLDDGRVGESAEISSPVDLNLRCPLDCEKSDVDVAHDLEKFDESCLVSI
jgi:hypothetical protein